MLSNRDGYQELDRSHIRNLLYLVKSRQTPDCAVEEGRRSTIYALLAKIALATKARLEWDGAAERFTNNDAANERLDYEYRRPWSHT